MYDVAIIGGGINGCGIARDAAGRGYKVLLAEKRDLAQGTSSGSTKLIHGGLRYLEYYEFRLVREALKERETLWGIAPHIISPMRFVLPYTKGLRPAWLLRAGLFLYDHIGGRKMLPGTRSLDLRIDSAGAPLKTGFARAFEYSDCWVDDARLVVLNALDASQRGAMIKTRTIVKHVRRENSHWRIVLYDTHTGREFEETSRLVVNATGAWVDEVLGNVAGMSTARNVRLVQGSHIVVRKLYGHDRSYFFQNADGRIFFAIPYEEDFTLIGTTDRDYSGDLDNVRISGEEVDYLCAAASEYFNKPVSQGDVVWSYSAVRPLFDDGASKAQEATRDYVLKVEGGSGPKLINIFGGKITTYRRLAEAAVGETDAALGRRTKSWTGSNCLPGGDFPVDGYEAQVARLSARHPYIDQRTAKRLVRSYGTIAHDIFAGAKGLPDLGEMFAAGLSEREVVYLCATEWAMTADDILWRRSKLGLKFDSAARQRLVNWLSAHEESHAIHTH
ncbi:MAG TPA: glycerol-3-phosphate dehydrogenase [Hyphomicrobiaceae bacterium]|nr:glycerol-3-phosphate dehydrogenase [Hyphomicrobiaceae bacterium]